MEQIEFEFEQMLIKKGDPDLINKWAELKSAIVKIMEVANDALKDS
jgi:hypothetical protein